MKAKQLAQLIDQMSDILGQISSILKSLPDGELQTAFSMPTKLQNPTTVTSPMELSITSPAPTFEITTTSLPTGSLEDLPGQLKQVPSEQLENFIRLSSAWKNRGNLKILAEQFGIRVLSKHTKSDLLTLIVTHIENRRAHSQIRNHQPEHATL